MPVPKSVTKITSKGIEYTSNVDAAQYYIYELSRAALRDVGKFVKTEWRKSFYEHFKRHSGKAGRAISYKVISGKYTQFPRVQIGLKNNKSAGFYGMFQEFGSSRTPRLGLLNDSVENNIATIIEIESKYLSGLDDEAKALAMISSEDDYTDENE